MAGLRISLPSWTTIGGEERRDDAEEDARAAAAVDEWYDFGNGATMIGNDTVAGLPEGTDDDSRGIIEADAGGMDDDEIGVLEDADGTGGMAEGGGAVEDEFAEEKVGCTTGSTSCVDAGRSRLGGITDAVLATDLDMINFSGSLVKIGLAGGIALGCVGAALEADERPNCRSNSAC